jgi:hypothetical protein
MLQRLNITPEVYWPSELDKVYTRGQIYQTTLDSLDLTHWPTNMKQVTFTALIADNNHGTESHTFLLLTLGGGAQEWQSHAVYKESKRHGIYKSTLWEPIRGGRGQLD